MKKIKVVMEFVVNVENTRNSSDVEDAIIDHLEQSLEAEELPDFSIEEEDQDEED